MKRRRPVARDRFGRTLEDARRAFRVEFGQAPTAAQLREFVGPNGAFRLGPARKRRRRNPELVQLLNPHGGGSLEAAKRAYLEFHGVEPKKVRKLPPGFPNLVAVGDLREITYRPTRGARRGPAFVHTFARGAVLAATPDGKQLVLLPHGKKPFRVDWDQGIVG